ncbi:MAG: hypothetical protein K5786_02690 [Treponema sp.]|nr:hypothetical protein [Treponema sp.]
MKSKRFFNSLLNLMILIITLIFFTACPGPSDADSVSDTVSDADSNTSNENPQPVTTQVVSISGTITSDTISTSSSGSITVKTDNTGSHYEFISQEQTTAAADNIRTASVDTTKGGFWKFFEGNSEKPKFTGTYKGNISSFAEILIAIEANVTAEDFKLTLTVTATTDDDGKLRTVSETKTFDFEVKKQSTSSDTSSFTFEAEIPSVTTTDTDAQEPVASNVTLNTLAGTYEGTLTYGKGEISNDSVTITGDTYLWKKNMNDENYYWRGKIFNKVSDNLFTLTNGEMTETEENGQPVNWSSEIGGIFIISAAYNATEDTISFISNKSFNPQTKEWVTQTLENLVFKKVQQ